MVRLSLFSKPFFLPIEILRCGSGHRNSTAFSSPAAPLPACGQKLRTPVSSTSSHSQGNEACGGAVTWVSGATVAGCQHRARGGLNMLPLMALS